MRETLRKLLAVPLFVALALGIVLAIGGLGSSLYLLFRPERGVLLLALLLGFCGVIGVLVSALLSGGVTWILSRVFVASIAEALGLAVFMGLLALVTGWVFSVLAYAEPPSKAMILLGCLVATGIMTVKTTSGEESARQIANVIIGSIGVAGLYLLTGNHAFLAVSYPGILLIGYLWVLVMLPTAEEKLQAEIEVELQSRADELERRVSEAGQAGLAGEALAIYRKELVDELRAEIVAERRRP